MAISTQYAKHLILYRQVLAGNKSAACIFCPIRATLIGQSRPWLQFPYSSQQFISNHFFGGESVCVGALIAPGDDVAIFLCPCF